VVVVRHEHPRVLVKLADIYHRVVGAMDELVPDDGSMTSREQKAWAILNGLATEIHAELERPTCTWFFCRSEQQSKPKCPAQCQVCEEDSDGMRRRAKGSVPR
jgi:hypothetical protein